MQHVAVKYSESSEKTYTFHNDGVPVAPGDRVLVETGKGTKVVVVASVREPAPDDKPLGFATKPILGLAPPPEEKPEGETP